MALWNIYDPKLRELGLVSHPDVMKAMYYSAARVMLTQLRSTPEGDQIEEDHQRDRQLIAGYIMDKTGAIEVVASAAASTTSRSRTSRRCARASACSSPS